MASLDKGQQDFLRAERWLDIAKSIAQAAELRRVDDDSHNYRVGELAGLIALKLGMSAKESEGIARAAPLHDIGSIYVPERILFKPAELTEEEFETVKSHVPLGAKMLQSSLSETLRLARLIVETHHERWDGSGYPNGLKGIQIPLVGQIVAVADTFDSMIHPRPYRAAIPVANTVSEIEGESGKRFDPQVVDAFSKIIQTRYWQPPNNVEEDPNRELLMRGSFSVLTPFDLLGMLSQNAQSGTLHLYTAFAHYRALFFEGQLIHAEFEEEYGEDALTKIVLKLDKSSRARFVLEAWLGPPPNPALYTITTSTQRLLLDIAVKLDHQRV